MTTQGIVDLGSKTSPSCAIVIFLWKNKTERTVSTMAYLTLTRKSFKVRWNCLRKYTLQVWYKSRLTGLLEMNVGKHRVGVLALHTSASAEFRGRKGEASCILKLAGQASLVVQWLRLFPCRGHGFSSRLGTKVPHATWCG